MVLSWLSEKLTSLTICPCFLARSTSGGSTKVVYFETLSSCPFLYSSWRERKTCRGSLDLWTSTTETHICLKELAGVIYDSFSSQRGKNKEPTYITGQSIGLFSSLVTWCDHGGEAAFSFGLLILLCVLQLPKKHKISQSGHLINTDAK